MAIKNTPRPKMKEGVLLWINVKIKKMFNNRIAIKNLKTQTWPQKIPKKQKSKKECPSELMLERLCDYFWRDCVNFFIGLWLFLERLHDFILERLHDYFWSVHDFLKILCNNFFGGVVYLFLGRLHDFLEVARLLFERLHDFFERLCDLQTKIFKNSKITH